MPRSLESATFARAFDEYVASARWQEPDGYYKRYRSRYEALTRCAATLAAPEPIDVLDIGGGQFALLSKILWNDRAAVADLAGPQFPYLRGHGIETITWNLCGGDQPVAGRFDLVFFSEVIEHLPIPGHLALEKLRLALRPGGTIICTTPNLYRPRNILYLATGIQLFDHFRYPTNESLGHVLEYSAEHLRFQFERAGFTNCSVELRHFGHSPVKLGHRALAWLGAPIYSFPRFRDSLLAIATAP